MENYTMVYVSRDGKMRKIYGKPGALRTVIKAHKLTMSDFVLIAGAPIGDNAVNYILGTKERLSVLKGN